MLLEPADYIRRNPCNPTGGKRLDGMAHFVLKKIPEITDVTRDEERQDLTSAAAAQFEATGQPFQDQESTGGLIAFSKECRAWTNSLG